MTPDVLFWFYKNFDICRERLIRLRCLNENVRVFALYGGPLSEAERAQSALIELVDDFYVYPYEKEADWKWRHGDQLIASWYRERGQALSWDTIFILQWDMLVLSPLHKIFSHLNPGEILLSGFRPLSSVAAWWPWADPQERDLQLFREQLRDRHSYTGELFACLFIIACLPRVFLKKYTEYGNQEVGFLEYTIPTLSQVYQIPVCTHHDFHPWWAANPETTHVPADQRTLNAVGDEVLYSVILAELSRSDGKRVFHPISKAFPGWLEQQSTAKALSYLFKLIELFVRTGSRCFRVAARVFQLNSKRSAEDT